MPYSSRLRLYLMDTGTEAGTWGTQTNTNLGTLLEQSIAGFVSVSMTDANYTLTTANGASDEARNMGLNLTGTLTLTREVICPTVTKFYVVKNSTTGSQSITFKTSGGTGITVANGKTAWVFCDGVNVVSAADFFGTAITTPGATLTNDLTFSGTGLRIRGDFTNATPSNRVFFQTSTATSPTTVSAMPNGAYTGTDLTQFAAFSGSDPNNASVIVMGLNSLVATLSTGVTGTGTNLPLTIGVANAERARFPTAGGFLAGTVSTTGSVSNVDPVVAGVFRTASGNVSATHDTFTTLFTIPNPGGTFLSTWIVSFAVLSDAPTNYNHAVLVVSNGIAATGTALIAGAQQAFQIAGGLTFQAKQTSGSTQTIQWSAVRLM